MQAPESGPPRHGPTGQPESARHSIVSGALRLTARPLAGVRVLVTRPEAQAASLRRALEEQGAETVAFPTVRIVEASDGGAALMQSAVRLAEYDRVMLTSVNGVARFLAAVEQAGTSGLLGRMRIACIGPATAQALRERGVEPDVVAREAVAEGLLRALGAELRGERILLPQAERARPVLREQLAARGAKVEAVAAYRSEADARGARQVRAMLDRGEIGVVTFTASSTVERYVEALGPDTGDALVAVIGPVTAATARSLGLSPGVIATQHTTGGLVDALVEHFNNPSQTKP